MAALDVADPDHERCARLIAESREDLVVPALVLQRTYADLKVGVVDASILALTERLGESRLATLDHRHFGTMRPRHVQALELLPTGPAGP